MSDADNPSFPGFGKFVPGFDFLQNLAKQAAGSATQNIPQLPNLGSWVAPTLNVEELDKRIQEFKAVQFWLDQNAMALKATIQALEVQKMTLATLKGMNFTMADMANAFKLKVADNMVGGAQRGADKAKTFPGLEIPPSSFQASQAEAQASEKAAEEKIAAAKAEPADGAAAAGVVDPMQWWGALTQQFQTIAADAMKEAAKKTAINATRSATAGLANNVVKTATDMATGMVKSMSGAASKTVAAGKAPATAKASPKPRTSAAAPARKAARKSAR